MNVYRTIKTWPRKAAILAFLLSMVIMPSLSAYGQNPADKKITLNLKSANVKDFFNEVSKQSGLSFFLQV